jgi:hypothetical protein
MIELITAFINLAVSLISLFTIIISSKKKRTPRRRGKSSSPPLVGVISL